MEALNTAQEKKDNSSNESINDHFMIEVPSESCEILLQIVCY